MAFIEVGDILAGISEGSSEALSFFTDTTAGRYIAGAAANKLIKTAENAVIDYAGSIQSELFERLEQKMSSDGHRMIIRPYLGIGNYFDDVKQVVSNTQQNNHPIYPPSADTSSMDKYAYDKEAHVYTPSLIHKPQVVYTSKPRLRHPADPKADMQFTHIVHPSHSISQYHSEPEPYQEISQVPSLQTLLSLSSYPDSTKVIASVPESEFKNNIQAHVNQHSTTYMKNHEMFHPDLHVALPANSQTKLSQAQRTQTGIPISSAPLGFPKNADLTQNPIQGYPYFTQDTGIQNIGVYGLATLI